MNSVLATPEGTRKSLYRLVDEFVDSFEDEEAAEAGVENVGLDAYAIVAIASNVDEDGDTAERPLWRFSTRNRFAQLGLISFVHLRLKEILK